MPFINAARRELANLNPGTSNHSILDYLINNALAAAVQSRGMRLKHTAIEAKSSLIDRPFNKDFWQRRETATYSLEHVQRATS
jgi:hypothetical protein